MRFLFYSVLLLVFPILTSGSEAHKFYVSTTTIEYVEEKQSLQIISKIFVDDIEDVLQLRYDPSISIGTKKETGEDAEYLKKYILQKFKVLVNGKPVTLTYIGKEYDIDVLKVYIEITKVPKLSSLEVENEILFEMFEDQQNIIHLKTPAKRRSMVLDKDNPKGLLNLE
ncbi:DUF6702 family protein [Altibacter sp.]|uniref:DUF6702 family protein n=1 Tax=Altibacter sp. TaxID=2024823 RepID=UPI000C8F8763|nr:DUF6702 family protein [Altibacter sp.]MAP54281.1 hypothetical protein [Altibacter sp.]